MDELRVLAGEWTMHIALQPEHGGPLDGHCTIAWMPGERLLTVRTEIAPPVPSSLSIIASTAGGYTQHYFDARGVIRLYAMTFRDRVWRLSRTTADFSPLEFCQRFTAAFDGDDVIRGAWERSPDGRDWELDFRLTYRRVAAR
jgi:hypothetical protein